MVSLREESEYLRLALAMGLVDKDMVIAWADRVVMASQDPQIEVIEVSLARSRPTDEIMGILASIPGEGDLTITAHHVLRLLRERLKAGDVSLESAVDMLWAYHVWADVPEGERLNAGNFPEYLYGAKEGYWGTLDGVREEVMQFIAEHADSSPSALPLAIEVQASKIIGEVVVP